MFHVLSFDPSRIEIASSPDGKTIVKKKTTRKEYRNITLANQHLLKHGLGVHDCHGQEITIATAEVFEWDQAAQTLSTLFCSGENLEHILRGSFGKARDMWTDLFRKIFELFKSGGFLWGDFAPRNMLWDQDRKTIWLVDFERDLHLRDCPVDQALFNRYVRNYSREEFSCFLNVQEQAILFRGFLNENYAGSLPVSHITSKRKTALLRHIFGDKASYQVAEVRQAEDIMAGVATPFQVHGVFFFPMDSLDRIGSTGGPHEYVQTVMAIKDLGDTERYRELRKRTENL